VSSVTKETTSNNEPEVAGKLPEEQRTTLYLTLGRRLPNTEKERRLAEQIKEGGAKGCR
jgi:hypothetical protein